MTTIDNSSHLADFALQNTQFQPEPPKQGLITHVAQSGETLPSIAQQYDVPDQAVIDANPQILNPDVVYAGQDVFVPAHQPFFSELTAAGSFFAGGGMRPSDLCDFFGTGGPTPYEANLQIDQLPRPNNSDIRNLPPEDRQPIIDERQREYNNQVIAIADKAIAEAKPPRMEDFRDLPPGLRKIAYEEAKASHAEQVAKLQERSLQAKQDNLNRDPEFRKLPPETQAQVRDTMTKRMRDPKDVTTIADMARSPGFNQLNPTEQKRLLNLVGGDNKHISEPSRREMANWLNDPTKDKSNPETFRKFLEEQPGLPGLLGFPEGKFEAQRADYTITGPERVENHGFRSGNGPALHYKVTVEGKTVDVYVAANQDPNLQYHTIDQVAKGLAAQSANGREGIKTVTVEPGRNPDDAHWEKQYNMPGFRSYMTAGGGQISIYPQQSNPSQTGFDGAFTHETGHILDQRTQANGQLDPKAWEAAMKSDQIDASGYARKSQAEDFAETYALYMSVKGTPQEAELRALMPERFRLLDELTK